MAETSAADLGIDLSEGSAPALYRWLVASILFGKPVQQSIGAEAYRAIVRHGLTSAAKLAATDHHALAAILDEAHYTRLDDSVADELHAVMSGIAGDHGSVAKLVRSSGSRAELSDRLQAYKGIGPKTVEIYLRDIPASVI